MTTRQAPGQRVARRRRGDDASPPVAPGGRRSQQRTTVSQPPAKVGSRLAGRRIRGVAELSESIDLRRRLRRLARQIERGRHNVRHMNSVETAIGECLDDAAVVGTARERWLLCEAATWGLAWMARTRRAGGSAGGILERLVRFARAAQADVSAGDTLPARFILTLARLFRDIEACRCLEADAAAALAAEMGRLVSGMGTVSVRGSAAVVERVSRWATCREVALATGQAAWDATAEESFARAVEVALRLLGRQGRMLVGPGRMPAAFSEALIEAAVGAAGNRVSRTAETMRSAAGDVKHQKLLQRDLHDSEAAVAIMRSGWERDAVRVLLEYRDAVPRLEIAVGDRLLVEGLWQWQVFKDGTLLTAEGPWSLSCWESDRKATFLEIVAPLAGGLQIDRQIVLLPRDRVLLLADAVTQRAGRSESANGHANTPARATGGITVESVVPLAASLEGEPAEETREILVYDTKPRMLALPLGLPEWKTAGRGRFTTEADGLVLSQAASGGRCYAPVWIDFDAKRQGRPLTWRQLTVADTRRNLPPHQASGFRVQEGLEQWLVYRALDAARNRTLLGCNVSCEFMLGRIGRKGVVDRLIEIQ